jgi:hypothetical protein
LLADQKAKMWRETESHLAPMEGIDANDLSQAGSGVVFCHNADPAIREALKELLDFRKGQAGRDNEKFYREFTADAPCFSNRAAMLRLRLMPARRSWHNS